MRTRRLTRTALLLAAAVFAVPTLAGLRSAPPAQAGICVTLDKIPDRPVFWGANMPWPNDDAEVCVRIGPTG